jgi:hypothetical protein
MPLKVLNAWPVSQRVVLGRNRKAVKSGSRGPKSQFQNAVPEADQMPFATNFGANPEALEPPEVFRDFFLVNQSTPIHPSHAAFHFRPFVAQTQGIPPAFGPASLAVLSSLHSLPVES